MRNLLGTLAISIATLAMVGCTSSHMKVVKKSPDSFKAAPNESIVVFMRPSRFGGAIQASVFDVSSEQNDFVGIVSSRTMVAYRTTPGEHTFMVVSENGDFLGANLEGGKTYYAVVEPRMGVWKARFGLDPVSRAEHGKRLDSWKRACKLLVNTPASEKWAKENAADVQQKRVAFMAKWMGKAPGDRPMLRPEDGM